MGSIFWTHDKPLGPNSFISLSIFFLCFFLSFSLTFSLSFLFLSQILSLPFNSTIVGFSPTLEQDTISVNVGLNPTKQPKWLCVTAFSMNLSHISIPERGSQVEWHGNRSSDCLSAGGYVARLQLTRLLLGSVWCFDP